MAATYVRQYGGTTVKLKGYDTGMRQMIAAEWMIPGLLPHAQAIKTRAQATATKRTGAYAASFKVQTGVGRGTGTPRTRFKRAYARVVNTHKAAFYLEYGTSRFKAHRTLRKAAGITKFDAEGDKYG